MLIETDDQNYYDIANALREITGTTELLTPAEMLELLKRHIPDCGVSYDSIDEDGNILEATTYGYKAVGLNGITDNTIINFSDTLNAIGEYAFYRSPITTFEIPEGVKEICEHAFYISDLEKVTLPSTLTIIHSGAFGICSDLVVSEFPKDCLVIGYCAFYSCHSITDLIFNESLVHLEQYAFWNCENLATVTFKGTPATIHAQAFYNCKNLTTINVPWAEGEIAGAPWGATNATIIYNHITG